VPSPQKNIVSHQPIGNRAAADRPTKSDPDRTSSNIPDPRLVSVRSQINPDGLLGGRWGTTLNLRTITVEESYNWRAAYRQDVENA